MLESIAIIYHISESSLSGDQHHELESMRVKNDVDQDWFQDESNIELYGTIKCENVALHRKNAQNQWTSSITILKTHFNF